MLPLRLVRNHRHATSTAAVRPDPRPRARLRAAIALLTTILWLIALQAGGAWAELTDYTVDGNGQCVANDMQPEVISVTATDICDGTPGDTVTVEFEVNIINNANSTRDDILFGVSDGPLDSDIQRDAHIVVSDCAGTLADIDPGIYDDLDTESPPTTDCLDLAGKQNVIATSSQTFSCDSVIDDATLEVFPTVGWEEQNHVIQTGNDPISGPKCFVDLATVTVPLGAKIRLYKETLGGTGTFNFTITGVSDLDGTADNVFNVSATTTADGVRAEATNPADGQPANIRPNSFSGTGYTAPVVITEAAAPGWDLSTFTCTDDATNATLGSFDAGTRAYTITAGELATDQNITCVATNDARGTLTLTKVVEDGGTGFGEAADGWTLGYDDGSGNSGSASNTATTPISVELPAGDYTITEVLNGLGYAYDAVLDCGTPQSTVSVTSDNTTATLGTATVTAGGTTDCTVTNTLKTASITLVKSVDNGGVTLGTLGAPGDWNLNYQIGGGSATALTTGQSFTAPVGASVTLTETANTVPAGLTYDLTGIDCGSYDDTSESATFTVTGDATCTYTNVLEVATLTLDKVIPDPNLGDLTEGDFTIFADGTATDVLLSGTGTSGTGEVSATVPTGTYTIGETPVSTDYDLTIDCGGATFDGDTSILTLTTAGATCTLTNSYNKAKLELTKAIGDLNAAITSTNYSAEVAAFLGSADSWTMSYASSGSSGSMTNADSAVTVLPAADYTFSETAPTVSSIDLSALPYDTAFACNGAARDPATDLEITADSSVSCTFTNTPKVGTITLLKTVDNGSIGTAQDTDWTLSFTGLASGSGVEGATEVTERVVPAGTYSFSESGGPTNYVLTDFSCSDGTSVTGTVDSPITSIPDVTVDDGENLTCTFTNSIATAKLTVTKVVVDNSTGGLAPTASAWSLQLGTETAGSTPYTVTVASGAYDLKEQLSGNAYTYDVSVSCQNGATVSPGADSVSDGSQVTVGSVTLTAGSDATCTITNTLRTVDLTLVKSVENGALTVGTATADDWTLSYAGQGFTATGDVSTGTTHTVPVGSYLFSEIGKTANAQDNYVLTSLVCGATDVTDTKTYDVQSDTTCTFTNTINKAQVTLTKAVVDSLGIALAADQWNLTVNGGAAGNNGAPSVTNVLVDAGTIALTESAGAHDLDYASSLSCTGAAGTVTDNADVDGTGSVVVAAGENVSCTFTNRLKTGSLKLVKSLNVALPGVEAADWTLHYDGVATSNPAAGSGAGLVDTVAVAAGDYNIREVLTDTSDEAATYDLTSLVCVDANNGNAVVYTDPLTAADDAWRKITVGDGQAVVCTFTNTTDAARLTLTKVVDDDDVAAGTVVPATGAWTLTATDQGDAANTLSGASGATKLVKAGTFDLTELLSSNSGDDLLQYDTAVSCEGTTSETGTGNTVTGDGSVKVGEVTLNAGDVVSCTITNTVKAATLTLVKSVPQNSLGVVPSGWDLSFDGPAGASGTGATGAPAVTTVKVPLGSYTLSEALNATATDPDYALFDIATLDCGAGPISRNADDTWTYEVTGNATCTFTNETGQARLTLIKRFVDAPEGVLGTVSEPADWTLFYENGSSGSGKTGEASVTNVSIQAGTYTIAEQLADSPFNYHASMNCTGATGGQSGGTATVNGGTKTTLGSIDVAAGDDVTCEITNTLRTGWLALVKQVPANDLGVDADGWDVSFDGPADADRSGKASVARVRVPEGDYDLSETLVDASGDHPSYKLTDLTCVKAGTETVIEQWTGTVASPVTLPKTVSISGDSSSDAHDVVCTFTNTTDAARLTLIKESVTGSLDLGTLDGVGDFTLSFAGPSSGSGATDDAAVTNASITAGSYTISEQITGGTLRYDATMTCTGADGFSGPAQGVLDRGNKLDIATFDIAAGENVTCRISNAVQTGTITLVKNVPENELGVEADDWNLTLTGQNTGVTRTGTSGVDDGGAEDVTGLVVPADVYDLSEALKAAFASSTEHAQFQLAELSCEITGSGGSGLTGSSLDLKSGDAAVCTFTNTPQTARVTLTKVLEGLGAYADLAADADDWTLTVGLASHTSGAWPSQEVFLGEGSHALSETKPDSDPFNYTLTDLSCVTEGGSPVTVDGDNNLVITSGEIGESITCTFTNTLDTARLTLVKDVENGSVTAGTAADTDWTLSYSGPGSITGQGTEGEGAITNVVVPTGSFTFSETGNTPNTANYSLTSLVCGGQDVTDTMTYEVTGDTTCVFTNTIDTAQLTLVKEVTNDNGGTAEAGDFTLSYNGTAATQGVAISVAAGDYTLSETGPDGYTLTSLSCAVTPASGDPSSTGDIKADPTITLNAGDSAVCTFANDDDASDIELAKVIVDEPAVAEAGDTVTYRFTVNLTEGSVWPLTNVNVTDPLDGLSAITLQSGDDADGLLEPGETWIYEATYTVTQDDVDGFGNSEATDECDSGRGIPNLATVTADENEEGDATELSDTASELLCLPAREPSIELVKTGTFDAGDDGVATADDVITYDFTITNTGNVTLTNVTLTELTGGVVLDDSTVPDELAPGESVDLTGIATYAITQADIDAGSFTNDARASGTPPVGDPVTDDDDDTQTFTQSPSIAIDKTGVLDDGGDGVDAGDVITYTFTVENTGNVTLTDVSVTDPLPGLSAIAFQSGDDNDNGKLDVDETWTYTATYAVTQVDIDAGGVDNTATASGQPPAGDPVTDDDDETVPLAQTPGIDLVKTGSFAAGEDGLANPGELITYTFTVENTGNVTLTDVSVTDPLPGLSAITFQSGDDGDGVLDVGETWTYTATYAVTQDDIEAGEVINLATATGTPPSEEPVSDEDGETVELPAEPAFDIDNRVFFDDGGPEGGWTENPQVVGVNTVNEFTNDVIATNIQLFAPGADPETDTPLQDADTDDDGQADDPVYLTYIIVIPNEGNVGLANGSLDFEVVQEVVDDADNVIGTVTIPVASGPTFIRAEGGDGLGGGAEILDVGESWVYYATILVTEDMVQPDRRRILSTATFTATRIGSDVPLEEVFDDALAPVLTLIELTRPESPGNDFDIVKTTPRKFVRQGDIVSWDITVTNNIDFFGVEEIVDVIDFLPAGFIYVDGSATVNDVPTDPVIDGNRLIFEGIGIPSPGEVTIHIETFVTGAVKPGEHVNRAIYIDDGGGSEEARASVIVEAEPVFDCGTVIGKVFDDKNQNGYQDPPTQPGVPTGLVANDAIYSTSGYAGKGQILNLPERVAPVTEPGIPGVRLVTADGKIITTDEFGRFHVGCADLPRDIGSNFLLKLDTRSLPSGYRLTTENPRVVRLTAGKMVKMNFGATISRLVRIDVAGPAFDPATDQPSEALRAALARSIPKFADKPVTLRISYVDKGEGRATINKRVRNVEKIVRQIWREHGKYRLMIEKTVQRPR